MNVRILKVSTDELAGATIRNGQPIELPSMHTGWRFNFGSRLRELPYASAYILVSEETPDEIEGCLIFQMKDKIRPYMAYLEVAPHNQTVPKKYGRVAGCLIAFACKQSFIRGRGDYQGLLTFHVFEENPKDQARLMGHYNRKYHAHMVSETAMVIGPDDGQSLIEEYLGSYV